MKNTRKQKNIFYKIYWTKDFILNNKRVEYKVFKIKF